MGGRARAGARAGGSGADRGAGLQSCRILDTLAEPAFACGLLPFRQLRDPSMQALASELRAAVVAR